jgi:integrase/recombinase XerD
MKQLQLSNDGYKTLLTNFKEWLSILGYSKSTVYSLPLKVKEFLHYLEIHNKYELVDITIKDIEAYYIHLQSRTNFTKEGGGLSSSYLNHHQWALKKLRQFVFKHHGIVIPYHLRLEKLPEISLKYLTVQEVKLLFEATNSNVLKTPLKQRYKALLVLLYSCGLRRLEASMLNVQDVLFDRGVLVVNKGKNSKQRYVPVNHHGMEILKDYLLGARMSFNKQGCNAVLLGQHGTRLGVSAIGKDIKTIVETTNSKDLIEKNVTAHMLRHSIATHLLERGMNIEDISKFLGHSSLESTQIYTHILDYDRL